MTVSEPSPKASPFVQDSSADLEQTLDLAQQLAQRLSIKPDDWHRNKSNRRVRALE
ncbi:MAG TPA: DUF6439 family protein, partial [Stenomitos sp.]